MNTIDFEIIYNEKIKRFILYITTKEGNLPVELLCFGSDEEKKNFKNNYDKDNKNIGECFYDSKLINDEVAINNYNLSKIKNDNNDDISDIFGSFVNKVPKDKEKYKGGWRFLKFRSDKLYSNFINTYQNIKICIKEDINMKEIIETVKKNSEIQLPDLNEEKNFMSALIWKKFFKKNKNKDEDEDDLFPEEDNNKNDLLNKKRKTPDYNKNEDENENNNENYDDEKDNEGNYEADLDKLCDDDDDYY